MRHVLMALLPALIPVCLPAQPDTSTDRARLSEALSRIRSGQVIHVARGGSEWPGRFGRGVPISPEWSGGYAGLFGDTLFLGSESAGLTEVPVSDIGSIWLHGDPPRPPFLGYLVGGAIGLLIGLAGDDEGLVPAEPLWVGMGAGLGGFVERLLRRTASGWRRIYP